LQPVAGDGDRLARLQHRHHLRGEASSDHGGAQFVLSGWSARASAMRASSGRRIGRQVDEGLGAAVELALLEVQDAAAQGLVGHGLLRPASIDTVTFRPRV
jgi:hypothetical protein